MYAQTFEKMFKQLNSYFAQESKTSVSNPNFTTCSGTADPVCRDEEGKMMPMTQEEEMLLPPSLPLSLFHLL